MVDESPLDHRAGFPQAGGMTQDDPQDTPTTNLSAEATARFVAAYLQTNPEFLGDHPEVLVAMAPRAKPGERVVDFQHFALQKLQAKTEHLQHEQADLLAAVRSSQSTTAQVHRAALALVAAGSLEALLDVLTHEIPVIFGVDVVRLGLESEAAHLYDTYYGESNYSGVAFISPGIVGASLRKSAVSLLANAEKHTPPLVEELFTECAALAVSCALIRLDLPHSARHGVLGLGSRVAGRFDAAASATEALHFLGQVLAIRLDSLLIANDILKPAP